MQLSISNIIDVSVSTPPIGLGQYNLSNIGLFVNEVPINPYLIGSFGSYVSPAAVATDWGTGSEAYAQALAVFSQAPNILAAGGVLNIFPIQSVILVA